MPKLWNDTIDAHRHAVSDAILDATADLAASEGLSAVTMSRIAEDAGIGRATLYKYFADIQQILIAWHRRQIDSHLEQLAAVRTSAADPGEALRAVLLAYGEIIRTRHGHALASLLHGLPHVRHAHDHLRAFVRSMVEEAVAARLVRSDVTADELAGFALAAITAAEGSRSKALVARLVDLVMNAIAVQ